MNPDLQTFLQAWTGGAEVSNAERQRLLHRLETDSAFRAECAEEIRLLGMIRAAQTPSPRWLDLRDALGLSADAPAQSSEDLASRVLHRVQEEPRQRAKPRWLSLRPLTAAAAGLVIGLFGASVVFGFVSPRAVATVSRLFELVDGSFEQQSGRIASGFPVAFGVWSGDEAEMVSDGAAKAPDGQQVLRFVRAEHESPLPNDGAASCDVYQLVDLRPFMAEAAPGNATLESSVQFRDARKASDESVKFISRLYILSGSPDFIQTDWLLFQKEALAVGSVFYESFGGSPQHWRTVTTRVLLPPDADFALVHLVAHKPKTAKDATASFGTQFADDVRLTLQTQPKLSVRLARP